MRIEFGGHQQIIAGVSERSDGSMVWHNKLPVNSSILENRNKYFNCVGIDPSRVVSAGIAHGFKVAAVGEKDAGGYLLDTDAIISNIPNLFLTVTVADCMPIFCYDYVNKSFGMIHAGWRGLVGGILENTIREFENSYGSKPENVQVIIGPHIESCHYQVGREVADKFFQENILNKSGSLFANLAGDAKMRFIKIGVKNIFVNSVCTYEYQRLFSFRRDKSSPLQGMVAYIGIKK